MIGLNVIYTFFADGETKSQFKYMYVELNE